MLGVKIESKLDTIIGPETEIKGDISVRGSLRIDGKVEGNVSAIESIFMGKTAQVKGDIHCRDGIFAGRIEGNLFAQGTVELQTGATLIGDVQCRNLILNKDAFLDGRVSMRETAE